MGELPGEQQQNMKNIGDVFIALREAQEALTEWAANPASGTAPDKAILKAINEAEKKTSKNAIDRKEDKPNSDGKFTDDSKKKNSVIVVAKAIDVAIASVVQANKALAGGDGGGESLECPDKLFARRGFQVLGPEGWRTFDQDERLILAMSSSGKPLISTLNDLSNRVLNEQPSRNIALLELTRERLKVSEGERALGAYEVNVDSPQQAPAALRNAIQAFNEEDE